MGGTFRFVSSEPILWNGGNRNTSAMGSSNIRHWKHVSKVILFYGARGHLLAGLSKYASLISVVTLRVCLLCRRHCKCAVKLFCCSETFGLSDPSALKTPARRLLSLTPANQHLLSIPLRQFIWILRLARAALKAQRALTISRLAPSQCRVRPLVLLRVKGGMMPTVTFLRYVFLFKQAFLRVF